MVQYLQVAWSHSRHGTILTGGLESLSTWYHTYKGLGVTQNMVQYLQVAWSHSGHGTAGTGVVGRSHCGEPGC